MTVRLPSESPFGFRRNLHQALGAYLNELLSEPIPAADMPHLYQRWCGVKIVEALLDSGWQIQGDPVGPLFLGGSIRFTSGSSWLLLWVEPRLTAREDHPTGLRCAYGTEAMPDYVFITDGPSGPDAFTLDPTLRTDAEVAGDKAKYLRLVVHAGYQLVAGVPVQRGPQRAWAAAPIRDAGCRVLADRLLPHGMIGALGTVPMNPKRWNPLPLAAWVQDIADHARAWSRTA